MGQRNGEVGSRSEERPPFWTRHTRWHFLFRLFVIWMINTGALALLARIVPGAHPGPIPPFTVALVIAILNALLWPLMVRLLLPLAFVSPRILSALLDGTAPANLTATTLARALPWSWAEQERRLGLHCD